MNRSYEKSQFEQLPPPPHSALCILLSFGVVDSVSSPSDETRPRSPVCCRLAHVKDPETAINHIKLPGQNYVEASPTPGNNDKSGWGWRDAAAAGFVWPGQQTDFTMGQFTYGTMI